MKKIFKYIWIVIIFMVLISCFTAAGIYNFGWNRGHSEKADCIIVLGCSVYGKIPSPFLRERTMEGIRLFKDGYGNYLIFSGGQGKGEEISEAQAMKNIAIENGISEEKIIMEDKSTSTNENIDNSYEIMKERRFKKAIVVSNKYHLKRASLMCKNHGMDADFKGVYLKDHKANEIMGFIREIPAIFKFHIMRN